MLASTLAINVQAKNKEAVEVRGGQQTIILSEEFNKPKKFTNYTVFVCSSAFANQIIKWPIDY